MFAISCLHKILMVYENIRNLLYFLLDLSVSQGGCSGLTILLLTRDACILLKVDYIPPHPLKEALELPNT